MKVSEEGSGPLFMEADADKARDFFREKSRAMEDKRMTEKEAVQEFIPDGCYFGVGGFGAVRIHNAIVHEVVRQRKKDLGFLGHTSTHDFQVLAAGKCFNRLDSAYIVGLEARGLSRNARRYMESGAVQVTEWSNYALDARLRAAADGVSFGLCRSMLGTDTMRVSAAKVVECPFTGQKYAAVPALWPDVAAIHVHFADMYGNAVIRGISVADLELARAAKRLIITTEKIVHNSVIRDRPTITSIPYYLVDAVVEVPFGSYPGNMPHLYFSDEEHLAEWLKAEKDEAEFEKFLDHYIYSCSNFQEYVERAGGLKRIETLQKAERVVED